MTVQDGGDGCTHVGHQEAKTAVNLIRARAWLIGGLADAADRREGPVDQAHHLANNDLFHRLPEKIAAVLASLAVKIVGVLQLHQDLLQELLRELFLLCKLADSKDRLPKGLDHPQVDQGAKRVFSTF